MSIHSGTLHTMILCKEMCANVFRDLAPIAKNLSVSRGVVENFDPFAGSQGLVARILFILLASESTRRGMGFVPPKKKPNYVLYRKQENKINVVIIIQ